MAHLPSYEEAVSGGHWLSIAASYVAVCDYARACRASRNFYAEFAPRLWNDPLQTIRLIGLQPHQDLDWFFYFVTRHCETVRAATRQLVTSLDFRGLVSGHPALIDYREFSKAIRLFSIRFPAVRCILLDGLVDYDPAEFLRPWNVADFCLDDSVPMPLMLSLDHCNLPLPNTFFRSAYWRQLVYLDLSDIPGSLQSLASNASFRPSVLPNLKILKIRSREMNDATLSSVLPAFREHLWSLDLSSNYLADDSVRTLTACFLSRPTVQTEVYFETEGKLAVVQDGEGKTARSNSFGTFVYIAESPQSSSFSHPERHLADSPAYDPNSPWRLGGRESLRSDRVEDVKTLLAGGVGKSIPSWHDVQAVEDRRLPCVLTHLHLSDNKKVTVKGISRLFRQARGHLRQFECASPSITAPLRTRTNMAGVLGCSHLFRPVIASNLQCLRIHHSLITLVPTVTDASMSTTESVLLAETVLRERAEIAFPMAFVPDMNPRLQSLTLTCLPRVSTGPLIDRLTRFLLLASEQEQTIHNTVHSKSHRSPSVLRGLRHIRLEFEAVPDINSVGTGLDELDTGALLHPSSEEFSFFGEGAWESEQNIAKADKDSRRFCFERHDKSSDLQSFANTASRADQPVRLTHYPLPDMLDVHGTHEYVRDTVSWEDSTVAVLVWVGDGILGTHRAVNAYMTNLANSTLWTDIGPATPDQTMAGVPPGSCIYNAAWDAILFTETMKDLPSLKTIDASQIGIISSHEFRDVVQAIRQFRNGTRSAYAAHKLSRGDSGEAKLPVAHDHWTGKLEILLKS